MNENYLKDIVTLAQKYKESVGDNFNHQVVKVDGKDVFIHFHESEIEIHILENKGDE